MPTIKYPKNPNTDTAFVEQDDGTKNRALMTAPQDISTLELPNNPNSTKGYVTVDGKKQRVILTADIGGGGGSSLPDQPGHSGEFLTTDGTDASWGSVSEVPSTTGATEGDVLTVDSNGDPAWTTPSGGGLPDQTGQSGKFLTTDGTDASWGTINALQNTATGTDSLSILGNAISSSNSIVLGKYAGKATGSATSGVYIGTGAGNIGSNLNASVFIGSNTGALTGAQSASYCIAIGSDAHTTANNAILLNVSGSAKTNSDTNTFKVANANGNFELMDANGNLPADRLASTTGLADGNYRLRLVMASGVPTLEWVAE